MPLTDSSQFDFVAVGLSDAGAWIVWFVTTDADGTGGTIELDEGPPESGSDDETALAILQTIYASDDGFQDANGDPLVVRIEGSPPFWHHSLDDLESHGFPNPFIAGSLEAWADLNRFRSVFTKDKGSVDEHSTTETRTLQLPANVEPMERTPASDNYNFPLENIRVIQETEMRVAFEVIIDASENVTEDGLDEYSLLIAFATWCQANKSAGTDFGTDYSASASFTTREITIDQDNGNGDIVFEPASLGYGLSNSKVTSWTLSCDRVSGAAFDATALYALMLDTKVSIPTTEGIEKPYIGHKDHKVIGSEFDFGNQRRIIMENDLLVLRTKDVNDKLFEVPMGSLYGRSLSYAKMPVNLSSIKTIPAKGYYDTFYFGHVETADGLIQIPSPPNLVIQEDTHVTYAFHNISDDYKCEIQDWEDDNLITLHPGEYAKFQVTLRGEGGGGEIIGTDIPVREMFHSGGRIGNMGTGWWRHGTLTTVYLRALRFDNNGAHERYHEDTFERTTAGVPSVQNHGAWQDETDWDVVGSFKLLKPAVVEIAWEYVLQITGSNSGGFSDANGIRLYRAPGDGGDTEQIWNATQDAWSGENDQRSFEVLRSNKYEANDRFFSLFKYNTTSNISIASVEIEQYRRLITARPIIRKEWTP